MSKSDFNVRLWLQELCTMDINRVKNLRYIVLVVMRIAAVVMLVGGFYPFMMVLFTTNPTNPFSSYGGSFNWFAYALGLWVPGIVLAYKGRLISKWVVPTPRNECLSCGYLLKNLKADHCPECGSQIPNSGKTQSNKDDQQTPLDINS